MSKHVLTGRYFDTIEMMGANGSWLVDESAVVAVHNGLAIECDHDLAGNSITIAGTVTGDDGAIAALGDRTKLKIAATGTVIGIIDMAGDDASFKNTGHVISSDMGVAAEAGGVKLSNDGIIDAATIGVFADALNGAFVNGKNGVISAGDTAIHVSGEDGAKQRIVNRGQISGDDIAISAGDASETVVNTGKITGDVDLGKGDDVFDTRHGAFKGDLEGGDGNDTLLTSSAKVHLIEDAVVSFETVKSTVSYTLDSNVERLILLGTKNLNGTGSDTYNILLGNVGDNVLKGMAGMDTIDGGKGNDRLFGGADNDTFGFATGYGKDEIVDFAAGDKVYLHNWNAIHNFNQLEDHAENHGADVWIKAGSDTLIIDHMHKADLQPGDFAF